MVYNIINKVRKQIYKHSDILLLVIIIGFLVIFCLYANNSSSNNLQNNLDIKKKININERFVNNFEELNLRNNKSNQNKSNILSQIKKSLSVIDKRLFNIGSNIINNVNQKVIPSLNKNVNPNNFEFVNISGIESFSGLPFMKQNVNSKQLTLNIKDDMPIDMQLKRMKIVLQGLKKELEDGELNNKNNRIVEGFNDMKANEILQEIGNLLHDISKKNIDKEITQEEDNNYTVEEEIIIRENNKNQEGRKRDKDLGESVYIESVESEGIDTIYHPRIQII
jgi:hypothetical protein